jgi:hypothetical protein
MTETSTAQNPRGDVESRRNKMRDRLIDAVSFAAALLVVFNYRPEGLCNQAIVGGGAYLVARLLYPLFLLLMPLTLGLLAALIYMSTISLASHSGVPAMVASTLLPVVAQVYWICSEWAATGTLFHPLPLFCVAWLILLGIWIAAQITMRRTSAD